MAEQVLIGPHLLVNGVNLSAWVQSLAINREGDLEEFTTGNPGGTVVYKRRLVGAVDFSVEVTFSDDFAASAPHQTLSAVFGTVFTVVAAMNGSTPAASNEVWTDSMTFSTLNSGGDVGSHLTKQVTFVHASGTPVADITP
jgi:hypothetical protein